MMHTYNNDSHTTFPTQADMKEETGNIIGTRALHIQPKFKMPYNDSEDIEVPQKEYSSVNKMKGNRRTYFR